MIPIAPEFLSTANIATGFIGINFATFAAFGIDKIKAEAGQWRIEEATLLLLALLGGTIGAYLGRSAFRHKIRKQPFSSRLFNIAVFQVVLLGAGVGWYSAG